MQSPFTKKGDKGDKAAGLGSMTPVEGKGAKRSIGSPLDKYSEDNKAAS